MMLITRDNSVVEEFCLAGILSRKPLASAGLAARHAVIAFLEPRLQQSHLQGHFDMQGVSRDRLKRSYSDCGR